MSQPKPELCFMCNEPDYRGHTCDPVKAAVKPAPQPEPTPELYRGRNGVDWEAETEFIKEIDAKAAQRSVWPVKSISVSEAQAAYPAAPPAGARETDTDRAQKWWEENGADYTADFIPHALAEFAASERARADAAEGLLCKVTDKLKEVRAEVDSLRSELREARDMLSRERKGEVWCWQDDPDDHPESLTCPVLVQADVIRRFVAAEAQVWDMREALTRLEQRRAEDADAINKMAQDAARSYPMRCLAVLAYTAGMSLRKSELGAVPRKEDKAQ